MVLAGLIKSSLIDYPGKISCVVFTQGCNLRCGFCHNPDLIPSSGTNNFGEVEFFEFLAKREGQLEGVVITGGEPTVQPDLIRFIQRIKDHGFLVKLDTNGTNPAVLATLLSNKMIDYVAMDIKGPLSKYSQISHYSDTNIIEKSIELIMKSGIDYEFRTTVLPRYHEMKDFNEIGKLLNNAKKYAIQGFRDENTFDRTLAGAEKFTKEQLEDIAATMRRYVDEVAIRENI